MSFTPTDGFWGMMGAIGAATITGFFTWLGLKKKRVMDTNITKSIINNSSISEILEKLQSEFNESILSSVIAITNHDIPANHQTIFSTDYQTKTIWGMPEPIEPVLAKYLHPVAMYGHNKAFPENFENEKTKDWYLSKKIQMSMFFSIGVGNFDLMGKREEAWLILVVNWNNYKQPDPKIMIRMHEYVTELRYAFKKIAKRKKLITT